LSENKMSQFLCLKVDSNGTQFFQKAHFQQ
jgi:hypothetical protein